MTKISVLVVEDHTIVRKGICSLLNANTGIEVVGEAEDGWEAIQKVEALLPDVVLMDITMPHLNGLDATRQIRKMFPQVKVLALTMYTNVEYINQALQAGSSGYIVKQAAPAELILAIQAVYRGDTFLSPSVSHTVIDEYLKHSGSLSQGDQNGKLTNREREVLQLIAEGYSTREIADRLQISIKTAGVHRANISDKLGIHNVTDFVKYALRKGIISLE
ncbi:MAG: response regulator transcription factor [Anaerolineaceae bacterium]|nr:response regulator transcription factor [Anaerolineaceae bacterium]